MDFLLVKTTDKAEKLFKLIANQTIYDIPDLSANEEYSSTSLLNDGEYFYLKDFSNLEYCPDFLKVPFDSTQYDQFDTRRFGDISYLLSVQNGDAETYYCFQKAPLQSKVVNKPLIDFHNLGQEPSFISKGHYIVINEEPDAIYVKSQDKLYFRSLDDIKSIFNKISAVYKQASPQETQDFVQESFIALGGTFNANKVGKGNRNRIIKAKEKLDNLDAGQKNKLFEYIHSFKPLLPYDSEQKKFTIKSDKDLTDLLLGIDERYYKTTITKDEHGQREKRVVKGYNRIS